MDCGWNSFMHKNQFLTPNLLFVSFPLLKFFCFLIGILSFFTLAYGSYEQSSSNDLSPKSTEIFLSQEQKSLSPIPEGWETYGERPDIFSVKSSPHKLGGFWDRAKPAQFSFVAQLLALTPPETLLYFIGRDSEYLYDIARLVTKGTPDFERIHLINISRSNVKDSNIKNYLTEQGIDDSITQTNKTILFIDTGFTGSMARIIETLFSEEVKKHFKSYLILSTDPNIPSSRSFLAYFNPLIASDDLVSMHQKISTYEHIPKFTERSSHFFKVGDSYHPISPIVSKEVALIDPRPSSSKKISTQYREDLKAYWDKPSTKKNFDKDLETFRWIKNIFLTQPEVNLFFQKQLDKLLKQDQKGLLRAQIYDTIEYLTKSERLSIRSNLTPLGIHYLYLKPDSLIYPEIPSKKESLIRENPVKWASVLENPTIGIPQLFEKKQWSLIRELLFLHVDQEIHSLLSQKLFSQGPTSKDLSNNSLNKSSHLFSENSANPYVKPSSDPSLESALDQKNQQDLRLDFVKYAKFNNLYFLVHQVFSNPSINYNTRELLNLIIEKGYPDILVELAEHTFSKPHTQHMTDLIKKLIETGQTSVLEALAKYTFSQPHTQNMTDLLKLLIKKSDVLVLSALAQYTFSKPHTQHMDDLILSILKKEDSVGIVKWSIIRYIFSQPHSQSMTQSLYYLVSKGDSQSLTWLIQYVFNQQHTRHRHDLLRILIERAQPYNLEFLSWYVFTQDRMPLSDEEKILKSSLDISSAKKRQFFLNQNLGPLKLQEFKIHSVKKNSQIFSCSQLWISL
jgi:hypothetical protein